jgi:hypothetical protein
MLSVRKLIGHILPLALIFPAVGFYDLTSGERMDREGQFGGIVKPTRRGGINDADTLIVLRAARSYESVSGVTTLRHVSSARKLYRCIPRSVLKLPSIQSNELCNGLM